MAACSQETLQWVPSASAAVAAAAFVFAVHKQRGDQRLIREGRAKAAWDSYLRMAMENPKLAAADVDVEKWSEASEAYEYFVYRMLYAAEEVISFAPKSRYWHGHIGSQVEFHKQYLGTWSEQDVSAFTPELAEIIRSKVSSHA